MSRSTAVALGARVIEKHFARCDMDGPDHKFALTPDELADYINVCRSLCHLAHHLSKTQAKRKWP